MSKITDKTWVPLGWVLGLFTIGMSVTITGAMWVSHVDDRLSRIEDKLGIRPYDASLDLVGKAHAR